MPKCDMKQTTDISKVQNHNDRKDIRELETKILAYRNGTMHDERFRHFRLTRGVYGQRQTGVQMFRTKIPFGRLTGEQLVRIADVAEQFTNGNLHLTTRQNIQLHHIKLDDSPAIWAALAETGVTGREACGNTVRNFTASAMAGVDPHEPFDVSPYAFASYEYFLRNPICQDMGRKIKIAFSSSEMDSAYTYFHDFGFVPRIEERTGIRGFKVVIGGGLGAQSIIAPTAYEFLPTDQIIPFMAASIRVFDRLGERQKRFKARLKFLVDELGLDEFLRLVDAERAGLDLQSVPIEPLDQEVVRGHTVDGIIETPFDSTSFDTWKRTNVFEQKQQGSYGIHIRVPLGNLNAEDARALVEITNQYTADDIRITVNQGLLLRFISSNDLPAVFNRLHLIGLALPGFGSTVDVTACPGTDTCNLGVTNSTALAQVLESLITNEFPELYGEREIQIKISGCMNSCGQHMAANIGFHGSSIKIGNDILPAMQVVLGGGVERDGTGSVADKVIKIPTKRIPQVVRSVIQHYRTHRLPDENFNTVFRRLGTKSYYDLLKPLANTKDLSSEDFQDWGQVDSETYVREIGVGECAGVSYDLVSAIISDAQDKGVLAQQSLTAGHFGDSLYHSYNVFVIGAKAILLSKEIMCNTHIGIIQDFQKEFGESALFNFSTPFETYVLSFNKETPAKEFAESYHNEAIQFLDNIVSYRSQPAAPQEDALVVQAYYSA